METSPQSDTCLLHDFQGQSIWIVTTEIHCFYTSIDNHLGTRSTRLMSAVEAGPSDIRALVCRLDNGILLRVQPPTEFVPLPRGNSHCLPPVSYTHLRAHETDSYLVCRLLPEKKTLHQRHRIPAPGH